MNGVFQLNREQIGKIDGAARGLLEDPGIMLEDEQIYSIVLKAGARPGAKPMVARMPSELIDECLARAPREARFADRRGDIQTAGLDSP